MVRLFILAGVASFQLAAFAAAEELKLPAPPAAVEEAAPLPAYVIEPPDVLRIDAVRLSPEPSHRLEAGDVVAVQLAGGSLDRPQEAQYTIDSEGKIDLGLALGRVRVAGQTVHECERQLRQLVGKTLAGRPTFTVSLSSVADFNQFLGNQTVQMDGRINLGAYGSVYVAGQTMEEAREAIQRKLAERLVEPQVAVDVAATHSKVYYVIQRTGDGYGDHVSRMQIYGNDNVIDALSLMGGVRRGTTRMWISRPAAAGGKETTLPVDWDGLAKGRAEAINHPLLPGDRLFIQRPLDAKVTPASAEEETDVPNYYMFVRPLLARAASASPQAAPVEAPPAEEAHGDERLVAFTIKVFEDSRGVLESLGSPSKCFAIDQAGVALESLEALERSQLITCVSRPQLMVQLGQKGSLQVGTPADEAQDSSAQALAIELCATEFDGELSVEIKMERRADGGTASIETRAEVKSGQTVVLNCESVSPRSKDRPAKRVYMTLTPTLRQ